MNDAPPIDHRQPCAARSQPVKTKSKKGTARMVEYECNRPSGHQGDPTQYTAKALVVHRWKDE